MAFKFFFLAALLCGSLVVSSAHPVGPNPPKDLTAACRDMTPGHGVPPSSDPAPYSITLGSKTIKSGGAVDVTVTGNTQENIIKGFMMQARNEEDIIVGEFQVMDEEFTRTLNCPNGVNNVLTQKFHPGKEERNTLTARWIAPEDFKGQIKFYTTVVQGFREFWVAIPSEQLTVE